MTKIVLTDDNGVETVFNPEVPQPQTAPVEPDAPRVVEETPAAETPAA